MSQVSKNAKKEAKRRQRRQQRVAEIALTQEHRFALLLEENKAASANYKEKVLELHRRLELNAGQKDIADMGQSSLTTALEVLGEQMSELRQLITSHEPAAHAIERAKFQRKIKKLIATKKSLTTVNLKMKRYDASAEASASVDKISTLSADADADVEC